jgi:hypothetical protein
MAKRLRVSQNASSSPSTTPVYKNKDGPFYRITPVCHQLLKCRLVHLVSKCAYLLGISSIVVRHPVSRSEGGYSNKTGYICYRFPVFLKLYTECKLTFWTPVATTCNACCNTMISCNFPHTVYTKCCVWHPNKHKFPSPQKH